MPIKINGTTLGSSNNLTFNGVQANYATLNGNIVWSRASSIPFTVADTGASFSVSTTTVSWTPPSLGTLVGSPTYSNGQNLGTVSTNTNRTQTFTVTVPNDSQWSNANQNVTFTLNDIQEATVLSPPIFTSFTATQSTTQVDAVDLAWTINNQGYANGSISVTYNGSTQTTFSSSSSGGTIHGLNPGTTEFISVSTTSSQGTGGSNASVSMLNEFEFSDGFVSFSVNNNGIPSVVVKNGASVSSLVPTTYDLSCTSIIRSNTITLNAPSGYWNSTVTEPESTTQSGYGNPAIAGSIAETSGSLTNIPASGGNGEHSTTITNPTSVGEWNIVYGGTGMTPTVRSGCGNRTAQTWTVAANTGAARSGTITLYAGSGQTTVLDTLSWSQDASTASSYSHILNKSTSSANACAELGTDTTVYSGFNVDPISGDDPIYSNSSLTTAAASGWYSDGTGVGYWNGSTWSSQTLCNLGGGPE